MLVIFQNKIIYMPSVPPFSRSEKLVDYAAVCRPVVWREERIRAADGVELALALGEIPRHTSSAATEKILEQKSARLKQKRVVILYFQGNGSSTPPRLPALSSILRALHNSPSCSNTTYTLAALSYRGFWTSRGRPTEAGLKRDALAALSWAFHIYPFSPSSSSSSITPSSPTEEEAEEELPHIVLWGQSLGAAVALDLAAHHHSSRIHGLILETPFLSISSMLLTLYPQRWLPYRYLSPFLRNHWDSLHALEHLASSSSSSSISAKDLEILILSAGADELVPASHSLELEQRAKQLGMQNVRRVEVKGALHNEVVGRAQGRKEIVGFLEKGGGENASSRFHG